MKTWSWKTVVRMDRYSGRLFIDGIEVIFNPAKNIYEEKIRLLTA